MTRRYCFFVFLVFLSILAVQSAFACGSIEKHFGTYEQHKNKSEVEAFLKTQTCGSADSYSPLYAEPVIARVLANAIDLEVSKDVIQKVFKIYNCLSFARHQDEHRKILKFLGQDKLSGLCNPDSLRKMYIVSSAGGANLRGKPDKKAKKVGAVAESVIVKNGRVYGDWVLVDTYKGTGYMHISTLMPYIIGDDLN